MSQKIQSYAGIAEVVSAAAVVITLLILVFEIRGNTDAMRATAAAASRDSLASSSDLILGFDDKTMKLMVDSTAPAATLKKLSAGERIRIKSMERSFFRRAEAQYFRYQMGLLDHEAWRTVRSRVVRNLRAPLWREIWDLENASVYTESFVNEIESNLALHDNATGAVR